MAAADILIKIVVINSAFSFVNVYSFPTYHAWSGEMGELSTDLLNVPPVLSYQLGSV